MGRCRQYLTFGMHLSLSFSSKDGARVSTVFFLHSTIFVDLLSEPRVTCRLDHRVTVTWSSTCTSLISGLCIWLFASFIRCLKADWSRNASLLEKIIYYPQDSSVCRHLSLWLDWKSWKLLLSGLAVYHLCSGWKDIKIGFCQKKTDQCITHSA